MNLIQLKQIEGLQAYIQQNVPAVLDGYQVVFQTGNQFISGDKTFFSTVYASGGAFLSGNLLVTGDSTFGQNAYISGQLWITGSDGSPIQVTSNVEDQPYLVYVTGEQQISGSKIFQQSITGNQEALISGNTYVSGQLWITGRDGLPMQITGAGGGGGGGGGSFSCSDMDGCSPVFVGMSGEMISGYNLKVGAGGASISGNTYITGDLTVIGEVALTGGAVVGEADGDSIFIIGVADGNDPRVGVGQYNAISDVVSLFHVSGNPNDINFTLQGNQLTSGNQYISGELWITGTDGLPVQLKNDGGSTSVNQPYITYITGDQFITGGKQFLSPITGHKGFYITGDHSSYISRIIDTQLRIYSSESDPTNDNSLGLIVGKNESGPANPSLSIYNYAGTESDLGSNLGHASMFYANSQHFNITNAKGSGDIRFVTVGNAIRNGAERSFNWYDPASTRMIIHSGGNIGIGVTGLDPTNSDLSREPLERLHVSGGNIRVDGALYITGLADTVTQVQEFGVKRAEINNNYTLSSQDKNKVLHFSPNSDIEVTLPVTNDFIDFSFTARHTANNTNYVGFKASDASVVSGISTGIKEQYAWAEVYRGSQGWHIYGDPTYIVPKGTTAAPTTTTAGPTTTTATPTTTTTATPTTTTAAPTNTRLLTEGLMMRFFGWDDPYTNTTSSFGNNQSVNINGSYETRDVFYANYKKDTLPQMTGALSSASYSNWEDATEDITDVHGSRHTGVYLRGADYLQFPQIQYDLNGGEWDSLNNEFNFLESIEDGFTVTLWMHNKFDGINPEDEDHQYKIWELGGDGTPTNVGLYYKYDGANSKRIYMRGSDNDYIYAQDAGGGGEGWSSIPDSIKSTTGDVWSFHAFSYGGGFVYNGPTDDRGGGNIMWVVGTGNPANAGNKPLFFSGDYTSIADGFEGGLGVNGGTFYKQFGGNGLNKFLEFNDTDASLIGKRGAGGGVAMPWTGYISDFRIYSGGLTTGQINSIFTGKGLV